MKRRQKTGPAVAPPASLLSQVSGLAATCAFLGIDACIEIVERHASMADIGENGPIDAALGEIRALRKLMEETGAKDWRRDPNT